MRNRSSRVNRLKDEVIAKVISLEMTSPSISDAPGQPNSNK